MGQLKGDGRAINVTTPDSTAITFGELYRIDGWNGFAMNDVLATLDPNTTGVNRKIALEVSAERIWLIQVPSGLSAARGTTLWWSSGAGFKKGTTDLVAQGTGGATGPAVKVEETKDANNVVGVRVLNVDYTI